MSSNHPSESMPTTSSSSSSSSSSNQLYSKLFSKYLAKSQIIAKIPSFYPQYSLSASMIDKNEAQEVTNSKREYHIKSTFTHSRHPDLLKFNETAHGNKFILCRNDKNTQKKATDELQDKTSQKQSTQTQNDASNNIAPDEQEEKSDQRAFNQSIKDIGKRYFDTRINPQIKCFHCKEVGHQAKSCPNQYQSNTICSSCGSNEHISHECPTKLICFKCGKPGHKITQCVEKGVKMCKRCGKGGHDEKICLLFIGQGQVDGANRGNHNNKMNERPIVNENDLLLCQIEQVGQEYYVQDESINNCLYSVKPAVQDDADQIEDNPHSISKLAKMLESDNLDFDLDFNLTLGMGARNQVKKKEINKKLKKQDFIPICCPICAGEHDFEQCTSSDGNKNLEKIYKQSYKFQLQEIKSPVRELLQTRKSDSKSKGINLFHTIYETDKPLKQKKVNLYNEKNQIFLCKSSKLNQLAIETKSKDSRLPQDKGYNNINTNRKDFGFNYDLCDVDEDLIQHSSQNSYQDEQIDDDIYKDGFYNSRKRNDRNYQNYKTESYRKRSQCKRSMNSKKSFTNNYNSDRFNKNRNGNREFYSHGNYKYSAPDKRKWEYKRNQSYHNRNFKGFSSQPNTYRWKGKQ